MIIHRSYKHNLSSCEIKGWKIWTHDLFDIRAVLYQVSYQASWELVALRVLWSLMSSYLSPQFKYMIFYISMSGLCFVYICTFFLRSKCKDTLIKIGTSLLSTWKWCTETVLSITVRPTYTSVINIKIFLLCIYLTNWRHFFMRLAIYWSPMNFVITLSK